MRFVYLIFLTFTITLKSYSAIDCPSFTKEFIDESKNNSNVESFERYLSKVVDTKFITKFSLGSSWKTLTPEQRKSFHDVYSRYIVSKYAINFTKYPIKSYSITNFKNDDRRPNICNIILVVNTIVNGQEKSYPLTATISMGDPYLVQDIIFENVSLIQTHKQEVSSLIQSKGFDGAIQAFKENIRQ